MQIRIVFFMVFGFYLSSQAKEANNQQWEIKRIGNSCYIQAGFLERKIDCTRQNFSTSALLVDGMQLNETELDEFQVTFWKASPNEKPQGINYSSEGGVEQTDAVKNQTDALAVNKKENKTGQNVQWIDSLPVTKTNFEDIFNRCSTWIVQPKSGTQCLSMTFSSDKVLKGLSVEFNYQIYQDFPVIRKWLKFKNGGDQWLKISDLAIEKLNLVQHYQNHTLLTPVTKGFDTSILAFHDAAASKGIVVASEVPSILRSLSAEGKVGYNPKFFEWVIGPGESFETEAILVYAFSGESYPTVSAVSTALDRCVENGFHSFLNQHILLPVDEGKSIAPVFCTWTNYAAEISDQNMRMAADIASRMGFKCFQLDAGWSDTGPDGGWAVSTPNPISKSFPDLKNLAGYINSKNMKTGLWYSVFINEKLADKSLDKTPLFSLPLIRRAGGLGLSLCYKQSRKQYVSDIVSLHKNYQADYFKQDLSNICYGDIAKGHESRTLKESYLQGLRGLFETQDAIHHLAPDVWLQLSHEIYWETPGPEADIAVLKHVDSYHAAPNEYWGAGNRKQLVNPSWNFRVDSLQQKLIQGAFRARNLMYGHRGLPLDRVEIFGAVTTNFKGSLTHEIIDRQICSWLMGAPLSFSGDLTSLTDANIELYHKRFSMLGDLQKKYGIYSCFQYSGVPAPTDEGWHWWGKLNQDGCGAVVVLRGKSGDENQKINIPWVLPDKKYKLKSLFSNADLGEYSGKQLQDGNVTIDLKPFTQEIIEVSSKE